MDRGIFESSEARVEPCYPYKESGLDHVFLRNVRVEKCPTCGNTAQSMLPSAEKISRVIATEIIKKKTLLHSTETVFLRKFLGLSAEDLARELNVEKIQVSKWEYGLKIMGLQLNRTFRRMVLEKLFDNEREISIFAAAYLFKIEPIAGALFPFFIDSDDFSVSYLG